VVRALQQVRLGIGGVRRERASRTIFEHSFALSVTENLSAEDLQAGVLSVTVGDFNVPGTLG
jgi:hypothetical protein